MAAMMTAAAQRSAKLSMRPAAAALGAHVQAVRGFATPKKKAAAKKSNKKGGEDANFELMLRNIKGRYVEACVRRHHRVLLIVCVYCAADAVNWIICASSEPWTEEDQQRFQEIGRRYNAQSTIEHNHFMRDVQTKIDLKWEAINALPPHLQQEALELDLASVPEERGFATWTPPIEGFRRYTDEDAE